MGSGMRPGRLGAMFAVVLLAGPAAAQDLGTDEQIERLDSVFAEYDNTRSPGCVLGVIEGDEVGIARGYGMANLDHGVPIRPGTVFRIGSISKEFTAAAILLLEADGELSIDDDIRMHLPEIPEFGRTITIRNLINHTSGIRDIFTLMRLKGRRSNDYYSPDDVLELLSRQQDLNFAPQSEYLYSNSGYYLLAEIVERVSGRTLREYTKERIFEPLGMVSTRFNDDHREIVERRAVGYSPKDDGGFQVRMDAIDITGAGALLTTVEDFARWVGNFDDPVVGGPDFPERMLERAVLTDGDTIDYAMGLRIDTHRGLPTYGHGGSWRGWRANFVRFPDQDVAVVVFCNLAGASPSSLARSAAGVLLDDVMEPEEDEEDEEEEEEEDFELAAEQLAEFAGDYYSEELDVTYALRMEEDTLVVTEPEPRRASLDPEEPDVFRARRDTFRFVRDEAGGIEELRIDAGRVRGLRLVPVGEAAAADRP